MRGYAHSSPALLIQYPSSVSNSTAGANSPEPRDAGHHRQPPDLGHKPDSTEHMRQPVAGRPEAGGKEGGLRVYKARGSDAHLAGNQCQKDVDSWA